jgi:hypothetical protein
MISACCSCIILYFEPHALHILILAIFAYAIDPVEQELEEQDQSEDTNPDLEQGNPRYI